MNLARQAHNAPEAHEAHEVHAPGRTWPVPAAVLILAGAGLAIAALAVLPPAVSRALLAEHGAVELPSALLPLLAAGMVLHGWRGGAGRWLAALILLGFAHRESDLDFHERLFALNLFQLGDYADPAFPLSEKITAAVIAAACLWVLGLFVWRQAPRFWRDLRAGEIYARALCAGLLLLAAAKLAEALGGQLFSGSSLVPLAVEEVGELTAQIFILQSVLFWRRLARAGSRRTGGRAPDPQRM